MEMPASEGSLARRTQVFPRLAKDQSFRVAYAVGARCRAILTQWRASEHTAVVRRGESLAQHPSVTALATV